MLDYKNLFHEKSKFYIQSHKKCLFKQNQYVLMRNTRDNELQLELVQNYINF